MALCGGLGGREDTEAEALVEASLCQEGGMGDRLDKGLSGRETVRQWGGLGCERRRRQALGSGLVDRAPAAPEAGTGSGEGGSPPGVEGSTLETLGGQGLSVDGWPAPGKSDQSRHHQEKLNHW